jgi:hypothetical protein
MNPEALSKVKARALAGAELSLAARLGYVGLLLVSAALTTVVVALWFTEPSLPSRTQIAFGAMSVIGGSWMVLAAWALKVRRPLFARDRVIAGGMAVTFSGVFVVGCVAAAIVAGGAAAYGALATSVVMLLAAIGALAGARRRFAELVARRQVLETKA